MYINIKIDKDLDGYLFDDSSCDLLDDSFMDNNSLSIFTSENAYSNCSFFCKKITDNLQHSRSGEMIRSYSIQLDNHSNYIFIYNNNASSQVIIENLMIIGN